MTTFRSRTFRTAVASSSQAQAMRDQSVGYLARCVLMRISRAPAPVCGLCLAIFFMVLTQTRADSHLGPPLKQTVRETFRPLWSCFGGPPDLSKLRNSRTKPAHAAPVRRIKKGSSRSLLSIFEPEDSDYAELDEAEKAYRMAQNSRKHPVTGSSDAESALEEMVQLYMGKINKIVKTSPASASASSTPGTVTAEAMKESALAMKDEEALDEEDNKILKEWMEEEAREAELEQMRQQLEAALAQQQEKEEEGPHVLEAKGEAVGDEGAWKEAQEEEAWRDAVLKACLPQSLEAKEGKQSMDAKEGVTSSKNGAPAPRRWSFGMGFVLNAKLRPRAKLLLASAKMGKEKALSLLRANGLLESAKAGKAKALSMLESAKAREAVVRDLLKILNSVVKRGTSVVAEKGGAVGKQILSARTFETIFLALAFLADSDSSDDSARSIRKMGFLSELDGWKKGDSGLTSREATC